jgi:ribosomal protein S18 acetylase RimI-like enzyme
MSQHGPPASHVRLATTADAAVAAQLLYDFNREFDSPTPEPPVLAERVRELVTGGDTAVLLGSLGGSGPIEGLAVLRFRPALWSAGLECYLAELYVVSDRRGHGLGRALMTAAIGLARARGADTMDLGTGEDDLAARALYESLGFTHREGGPDGPVNYAYELDLNG